MLKYLKKCLLSFSLLGIIVLPGYTQNSYGKFNGSVVVEWVRSPQKPDRKMKLVEKFEYIDPNGTVWSVPSGTVVDGASIPLFFWRTVGPPFVGNYREASVVHDYFCETQLRPWKKVHRMFYHATLAGGVPKAKANAMYAAVYAGGPRWDVITVAAPNSNGQGDDSNPYTADAPETNRPTSSELPNRVKVKIETNYDEKQLESEIEWIEQNDPSLETIEQRINDIVREQNIERVPN